MLTLEDFCAQNCMHVAARGQSVEVMKSLLRAAENEDVLAQMLLSRDHALGSLALQRWSGRFWKLPSACAYGWSLY